MVINIILLVIFLGSFSVLWYRVSQKIPRLAAVSDEVIDTYIREESGKLHVFIVEFKSLFKEERYKELLKKLWGKTLYRLHIWLLRLDNKITVSLQDLRPGMMTAVGAPQPVKTEAEPKPTVVEERPIYVAETHSRRIQEVRVKRKRKPKIAKISTDLPE